MFSWHSINISVCSSEIDILALNSGLTTGSIATLPLPTNRIPVHRKSPSSQHYQCQVAITICWFPFIHSVRHSVKMSWPRTSNDPSQGSISLQIITRDSDVESLAGVTVLCWSSINHLETTLQTMRLQTYYLSNASFGTWIFCVCSDEVKRPSNFPTSYS